MSQVLQRCRARTRRPPVLGASTDPGFNAKLNASELWTNDYDAGELLSPCVSTSTRRAACYFARTALSQGSRYGVRYGARSKRRQTARARSPKERIPKMRMETIILCEVLCWRWEGSQPSHPRFVPRCKRESGKTRTHVFELLEVSFDDVEVTAGVAERVEVATEDLEQAKDVARGCSE